MKKHNVVPLIVAFVLSIGVIVGAWAGQDGFLNGLTITTSSTGYEVTLKKDGDTEFKSTYEISDTIDLIPCVYDNGQFYDRDGNRVTEDQQYVKTYSFTIKTDHVGSKLDSHMDILNGDLPAKCYINLNGTGFLPANDNYIGKMIKETTTMIVAFIIDGEEYTNNITDYFAQVNLTLHFS